MHLSELEDVFRQWIEVLDSIGLAVRHVHSFADMPEGMALVTVLTSVALDPERRTRSNNRTKYEGVPLARVRYVVAVNGATQPGQAERALVSVLADVDRQQKMNVVTEPMAASWWLAYGQPPLPAFQIEFHITESGRGSNAPLVEKHRIDMEAK